MYQFMSEPLFQLRVVQGFPGFPRRGFHRRKFLGAFGGGLGGGWRRQRDPTLTRGSPEAPPTCRLSGEGRGVTPRPTPGAQPADAERRWRMTSAVPATFQPISPASWHPNPGPPKPEATRANEEWAGKEGQAASLLGRRGPAARIQAARGRARGCGAAPAGVGGRAGWQVSAASAFGSDGAAPGSCGRPFALAPRPPPAPSTAASCRRRPGPAGRAAAARASSAALGRSGRGELGAARRRARGPRPPRWPLAPRRARRGPRLRPPPGLHRQADQQYAPGERARPGRPPRLGRPSGPAAPGGRSAPIARFEASARPRLRRAARRGGGGGRGGCGPWGCVSS